MAAAASERCCRDTNVPSCLPEWQECTGHDVFVGTPVSHWTTVVAVSSTPALASLTTATQAASTIMCSDSAVLQHTRTNHVCGQLQLADPTMSTVWHTRVTSRLRSLSVLPRSLHAAMHLITEMQSEATLVQQHATSGQRPAPPSHSSDCTTRSGGLLGVPRGVLQQEAAGRCKHSRRLY